MKFPSRYLSNELQVLVNAVTVEVKSPKNQMSGFPTSQALEAFHAGKLYE
jgi:hypothetical protein